MSLKVAAICEDHTNDQYIVRPVIQSLLGHLGKPKAQVTVVTSPRLHGFDDVMSQACELLERWGAVSDVVVFAVDTDCEDGIKRDKNKILALGNRLASCESNGEKAVALLAREEVETWALWGSRANLNSRWENVRDECHPKERYFNGLITDADRNRPDGGRARLMEMSLSGGWQSIRTGCPELSDFEVKMQEIIG